MTKLAIVLFNLGGPDGPAAVQPFLFNLFNDKAIIPAPDLVRWGIAQLISRTREKSAQANYAKMGGGSPIVRETTRQADALEQALRREGREVKVFLAMRYWHPFIEETVKKVTAWAPDETVLLPLYPQFSTTTTGSSLAGWKKAGGPKARLVCCYPDHYGFLETNAQLINEAWFNAGKPSNARVLFSAHGLPESTIKRGDPYQIQVEETVTAMRGLLDPRLEAVVCYQSRVGPMKWIGPSTESELARAARDEKGVIVCPIAFVSEHIETLVELDEEYKEKAHELRVPFYIRIAAPGTKAEFISGLADLVEKALLDEKQVTTGRKIVCDPPCAACPRGF